MKRGQLWWADLPDPEGSEPGYRRPVVIVQADEFNDSKINTVIAVVVTGNLYRAGVPGNVLLSKSQSSLPKDSVVVVSQVITFDKDLLAEQIGWIDSVTMRRIDQGLRLALAL